MICAWIETSRADTGSSATMKSGFEGERAGEADALPLAARELVRVARAASAGRPTISSSSRTRASACLPLARPCVAQRLADDPADAVARVERRERVLEDHLHAPAKRSHARLVERREVLPVEDDAPAGRLVEQEHRAAERRLAAARLADEAERLAAADREADAVDRLDVADVAVEQEPALDREVDLEVVDARRGRRWPPRSSLIRPRPAGCVAHSSRRHGVEAGDAVVGLDLGERRHAPRATPRRRSGSGAAKGQELGGVQHVARRAGIGVSRLRRAASSRGTLCSRPSVYGCRGRAKIWSAAPVSTNMPAVHDVRRARTCRRRRRGRG